MAQHDESESAQYSGDHERSFITAELSNLRQVDATIPQALKEKDIADMRGEREAGFCDM